MLKSDYLLTLVLFFLVDIICGFHTHVKSRKLSLQFRFHRNEDYNVIGKSSCSPSSYDLRPVRSCPDTFALYSTSASSSETTDEKPKGRSYTVFTPYQKFRWAQQKTLDNTRQNEQRIDPFRFRDFKRPRPVPKRLLYKIYIYLNLYNFIF
jgi:hypothetical protein